MRNNSISMYRLKLRGISSSIICHKYLSAAVSMSLSPTNWASFAGSMAHLFDQTYALSSTATVGLESKE
jgi:hypothetical protein